MHVMYVFLLLFSLQGYEEVHVPAPVTPKFGQDEKVISPVIICGVVFSLPLDLSAYEHF